MSQQIQVGQTISTPNGQEEYLIKSQLGHGTSGIVYLVELRQADNQQQFSQLAMKVQENIESNEMEIMKTLINNQCPNLLNIRKYWKSNDKVFIIMDLAADGNLYQFMEKNRNTLSPQAIQDIFIQLCLGVQQLHRLNIIHRDLKPENILLQQSPLTQKYIFKICDYGLSKRTLNTHTKNIGTIYYMAPELLKNTGGYTKSIDIWALGCIWYSLVNNNEDLFTGAYQKDIQQSLQNATQPEIDNAIQQLKFNDWEKQLMKSMICIDINKRKTINQILEQINPQNNQNQEGPNRIVNQPNIVKIPPQISQIPQNPYINKVKPTPPQIISNQQFNLNNQLNQPNIIKINPQITQNQTQYNSEDIEKLQSLFQQLQKEFNLVKQQVEDSNINSNLRINQVESQQKKLDNLQLQAQESLQNQIKQIATTVEEQNFNLKSNYDKDFSEVKQQFVLISRFEEQIQKLPNIIAEQINNQSLIFNQNIQQVQKNGVQILEQKQEIVQLQQQIKQIPSKIEDKINFSIQMHDKEISQLQQQFNLIQKTDQQIENLQQEMKLISSSVETTKTIQQNLSDSNILYQKQQVEKQMITDKQVEDLQQKMKELPNIFESKTMNSIRKCDEDILQLKQNIKEILKSESLIKELQEQMKSLPTTIENKFVNQSEKFDKNILQLNQQINEIKESDQQQTQRMQEQQTQLTNTIEITKQNLESNFTQAIQLIFQQLEQLLESEKSLFKSNEEIIRATNEIQNININLESNFSKEIQEIKQQASNQSLKSEQYMKKIQEEIQAVNIIIQNVQTESKENLDQSNKNFKQQINEQMQSEIIQIRKTIENELINSMKRLDEGILQFKQYLLDQTSKSGQQYETFYSEMKQNIIKIENQLENEIKQLSNNFKSQQITTESKFVKEILEIKQQFNSIQTTDQLIQNLQYEMKSIPDLIENTKRNLMQRSDSETLKLQKQMENTFNPDQKIQIFEKEIHQIMASMEKKLQSKFDSEITLLKLQVGQQKKHTKQFESDLSTLQVDFKKQTQYTSNNLSYSEYSQLKQKVDLIKSIENTVFDNIEKLKIFDKEIGKLYQFHKDFHQKVERLEQEWKAFKDHQNQSQQRSASRQNLQIAPPPSTYLGKYYRPTTHQYQ